MKLNQKGIAHIFALVVLTIGLVAGVYLVQQTQIFKPKASETGGIKVIDNLRREVQGNTTKTIFVYLEIDLPTWTTQSPFHLLKPVHAANVFPDSELSGNSQASQFANRLRVSLDSNKLDPSAECEITGDPETNCREIEIINPSREQFVSWVLPKKAGSYTIYARVFSDLGNHRNLLTNVNYEDTSDYGWELPGFLIAGQAFITTVSEYARALPGTAAFNAIAELVYNVHTAGETIVTFSHAQQVGVNVDLIKTNNEVEFIYDEEQLKNLDMSIEFFPDPDSITGEARIMILPGINPGYWEENMTVGLNIALGEVGGRILGNIANKAVTKTSNYFNAKSIKVEIPSVKTEVPNVSLSKDQKVDEMLDLVTEKIVNTPGNRLSPAAEEKIKTYIKTDKDFEVHLQKGAGNTGGKYIPASPEEKAAAMVSQINESDMTFADKVVPQDNNPGYVLVEWYRNGQLTASRRLGGLPNGLVVYPERKTAGEETVRLYRMVTDYDFDQHQLGSALRDGKVSMSQVQDFYDGTISFEDLIAHSPYKSALQTFYDIVQNVNPDETPWQLAIRVHTLCARSINCGSIFVSTTSDFGQLSAYQGKQWWGSGDRGFTAALVLEVPKSKVINFDEVLGQPQGEAEWGVVGEIQEEWIKGILTHSSTGTQEQLNVLLKTFEENN